ncbi:MAG: sugar ABC transporter permease, partial [Thermoflexales bacterium]|nr:sugar ABC transporter permease [Thermoflexales bacterium]
MTTAMNRSAQKRAGGLRRSEWKWGYLFIGLNLLAFLVFSLGPILASLAMSFMNWSILRPPEFVGLANVERLLDDDLFFTTLGNTLFFAASNVFLVTVFSFIIAVLLNQPIRGRTLFRTAFFLPSITLVVSVAMIWQWILNPQGGLLNYALQLLHVPQPQWLADRQMAMPTLITISVWQHLGYYAVVYLAGLQGIPNEYYEAAQIDGATGLQRTVHITVPLIAPTTFFVIVTSLIASWQVFELPYLLTGGGPANATRTLQMYIYSQAFGSF